MNAWKVVGLAAVLALPPLAATTSGCATTQRPGEQMDDAQIAAEVKARLTGERLSNLVNIEINVTNGVVTMAGEVPDEDTKREAERIVKGVEGVRGVNNELQVSGE